MKRQDGIEIETARPVHRPGGAVVGTIRYVPTHQMDNDDAGRRTHRPRDDIVSMQVVVAGFCQLDTRWHNASHYKDVLARKHPSLQAFVAEHFVMNNDHTICFWATAPVELMELQERPYGRWPDDWQPKPIDLNIDDYEVDGLQQVPRIASPWNEEVTDLDRQQLAFTFRVDLPAHLPPTTIATSCRYYYEVLLRVQYSTSAAVAGVDTAAATTSGIVMRFPIELYTAAPVHAVPQTLPAAGHVEIGTLHGMACSNGLPSYVKAMDLHQPIHATLPHPRSGAHYGHLTSQHVHTMKVTDEHGRPVAILTAMGIQQMHPGGRAVLTFDFGRDRDHVPCYQVSAAVLGAEYALRPDTGPTSKVKARSLLLATAHAYTDPDCTVCQPLDLLLPSDAPCTTHTPLLEIAVTCRIDLTIGVGGSSSSSSSRGTVDGNTTTPPTFRTLTLELPCQIVSDTFGYEFPEPNDGQARVERARTVWQRGWPVDATDARLFPLNGIHDELQALSLSMAQKVGILPLRPALTATTSRDE